MKKAFVVLPAITALLLTWLACSKKSSSGGTTNPPAAEAKAPTLTPDSIKGITISSAVFYGKVTSNGNATITERGVHFGTTPNPTGNRTVATSYQTNGQFIADLKNLLPNTKYYVRGFAVNSAGTSYTSDLEFTTTSVPAPTLFTDTVFASGAFTLFAAGRVTDNKGITFKEVGICLSKTQNPTITDTKVLASSATEQSLFLRFNGLEAATAYYIRTFTTDVYGTTTYGENVPVNTIAKGNVTYTLEQNANPTDDEKAAYARIKAAFDEACTYYNNYTSITKVLKVTYNTGVLTADATIAGNIRMGPNASYQKTGTALHEMAHSVGVGQHVIWTNTLIAGGVYQGYFANRMLRFMTRNPTEALKGDTQHFWPYGINGAGEDTGAEMLYLTNVFIVQGMKKDGLPSSN